MVKVSPRLKLELGPVVLVFVVQPAKLVFAGGTKEEPDCTVTVSPGKRLGTVSAGTVPVPPLAS